MGARDRVLDRVMILVEGGTITYDNRFVVDATGDAKRMLENAMGLDEFYMYPSDRRWLEEEETEAPEVSPTDAPTQGPTKSPTDAPTQGPTKSPTDVPTQGPTEDVTLTVV